MFTRQTQGLIWIKGWANSICRYARPLRLVASLSHLYGNFALTDTWASALRSDWLSLSYDKYSGGIRATAIDFVYQPFTHFAFGFGVHTLTLKLDVDNTNSKLETRLVFQGPAAFVSFSY